MALPKPRMPPKPYLQFRVRRVIPVIATHRENEVYGDVLDLDQPFQFNTTLFPRESRFFGIQPSFLLADGTGIYLGQEDGRTTLYRQATGRPLIVV